MFTYLSPDCQELIWRMYFKAHVLTRIQSYPFKHTHILDHDEPPHTSIGHVPNTPFILRRFTNGYSNRHTFNERNRIEWMAYVEGYHRCLLYYAGNWCKNPQCYKGLKMEVLLDDLHILEIGWSGSIPFQRERGNNGRNYSAYQIKCLLVEFWKDCNARYIQKLWKVIVFHKRKRQLSS